MRDTSTSMALRTLGSGKWSATSSRLALLASRLPISGKLYWLLVSGGSLACPPLPRLHEDQAHSRLTSAITAPQTPRLRPSAAGAYAAPPLSGPRRAALLGTCARAAPLGAIRPRMDVR